MDELRICSALFLRFLRVRTGPKLQAHRFAGVPILFTARSHMTPLLLNRASYATTFATANLGFTARAGRTGPEEIRSGNPGGPARSDQRLKVVDLPRASMPAPGSFTDT